MENKVKQRHILRARWMDYKDPTIMMITIVTTDRKPLLGQLIGEKIELTTIGLAVAREIENIPTYNGAEAIEIYSYIIMPDHVHILLHVHERLSTHIGNYIRWFKKRCLDDGCALKVPSLSDKTLFAPEYHDRILKGKNQLAHMKRYIQDNPRRLALKRTNKELFRIHQNIQLNDIACTALGNMFLADYPLKQVVQCSRRFTQAQIDELKAECIALAEQGVVHITAAISEGEKQIARALREAEYPLIVLLHEGFPKPDSPHYQYYKPTGVYFEACAKGKLLLLEPHQEALELAEVVEKTEEKVGKIPHDTQRYRFVAMNVLAKKIAGEV